jgi:hypothetical protein
MKTVKIRGRRIHLKSLTQVVPASIWWPKSQGITFHVYYGPCTKSLRESKRSRLFIQISRGGSYTVLLAYVVLSPSRKKSIYLRYLSLHAWIKLFWKSLGHNYRFFKKVTIHTLYSVCWVSAASPLDSPRNRCPPCQCLELKTQIDSDLWLICDPKLNLLSSF